jgi:hypothetical protein
MEQSPREADRYLTTQEIPSILWNPEVQYHVDRIPPLVSILS